jgi:hypothetical protein
MSASAFSASATISGSLSDVCLIMTLMPMSLV